jgi:hypothetical protein
VRLTSETRCAQTMVTVYLVPARGVVATRLWQALVDVQVAVVASISRTAETEVASCKS